MRCRFVSRRGSRCPPGAMEAREGRSTATMRAGTSTLDHFMTCESYVLRASASACIAPAELSVPGCSSSHEPPLSKINKSCVFVLTPAPRRTRTQAHKCRERGGSSTRDAIEAPR
jgi:hypothetical protein